MTALFSRNNKVVHTWIRSSRKIKNHSENAETVMVRNKFLAFISANKEFRHVLLANIFNRVGDSVDTILFTWIVYSLTGSAAWSAVIFGLNQGTSVILQPLTGPFIDKYSRKRLLVLSDLIRIGLVLFLIFTYISNTISPYELAIITILTSAAESVHLPAATAVVQSTLSDETYDEGAGYNVSLSRIGVLVGTAFSGFLIAFLGIFIAMLIDLASFGISIFLFAILHENVREGAEKADRMNYIRNLREGWGYLKGTKGLLLLCAESAVLNIAVVPFDSLLAPIAAEIYHSDARMVSILSISVTLGIMCGSFFYGKIRNKNYQLLAKGGIILGGYYCVLALLPELHTPVWGTDVIVSVCSLFVGISLGTMITFVQSSFIRSVPEQYIGRISAIRYSISYCLAPIASFIIALSRSVLSVAMIFIVSGMLVIVAFAILFLLNRSRMLQRASLNSDNDE